MANLIKSNFYEKIAIIPQEQWTNNAKWETLNPYKSILQQRDNLSTRRQQ